MFMLWENIRQFLIPNMKHAGIKLVKNGKQEKM